MMKTQCMLCIELVTAILFFAGVTENLEVTYEDIEHLNATCPGADNCKEDRFKDDLDWYNCNCDEFCNQYDTCCVDSKYRDDERRIKRTSTCAKIYRTHLRVFMVDSCDRNWVGDNHTEELCMANPEDKEDLFLAVPVTNHKTGITYRNYYCAACNNETDKDQLTFWDLNLVSKSEDIKSSPMPEIQFLSNKRIWIVGNLTDNIINATVNPSLKVPKEIEEMVDECVPDVVSGCSDDWNDTVVADKCAAYMAIVRVISSDGYLKTFRNPHCVICNRESLDKLYCSKRRKPSSFPVLPSNTFFVRLFSMYDKENKCEDVEVYDTLAKKCRKVYKG